MTRVCLATSADASEKYSIKKRKGALNCFSIKRSDCSWKRTKYIIFCLLFFLGLQHGVGQNQNSRKKQLHEGGSSHSSHNSHNKAALPPGSRLQQPFFDTLIDPDTGQGGRNVTTAEGGKALLFCTIRSLGDNNTVSQTY